MKPVTDIDKSQKTDEVIADYLQAVEAGDAPDRNELILAHPSVQTGLESFFSAYDMMHGTTCDTLESAESFEAGRNLGRYRLMRVIGAGAFGNVWLGFDCQLKRAVAIKVPNRQQFSTDQQRESFLLEAQTVAQLEHPNIVSIYDVGETESGEIYLVSRFIAGVNLSNDITQRPLSFVDSARCTAIIANALAYAHSRQIVHRDIKPSNILIDATTRQPYVTDFGLAQENSPEKNDSTMAGTPAYMSPEQAAGKSIDHRSDIFSLGVVLYELLTGSKPFQGDSARQYMKSIQQDRPKLLKEHRADMPDSLQAICDKALSKLPGARYSSATLLQGDLNEFVQSQTTPELDETIETNRQLEPKKDESPNVQNSFRRSLIAFAILAAIAFAIGYAFVPGLLSKSGKQRSTEAKRQTSVESTKTQLSSVERSESTQAPIALDAVEILPERQIAIAAIQRGGTVELSDPDESIEISRLEDMPSGKVQIEWLMFDPNSDVDDDFVASFKGLANIEGIDFYGTDITDAALLELSQTTSLTHVYAAQTAITDAGVKAIAKLPNLRKLNLAGTAITNESIKYLAGNTELIRLNIADTRVNDEAMQQIATLTNLVDLDMQLCQISDKGLKYLYGLKALEKLEVDNAKITPEGLFYLDKCPLSYVVLPSHFTQGDVARFKKRHRNCHVDLD